MRARPAPRVTPAQPRRLKGPPKRPSRDRARHPRRPSRRHPPSLPRHGWCGSGKQSTVRRSRDFRWAAAKRLQRPRRRRQTRPCRGKPPTPCPPATMSRPPRRRKLSSDRPPAKALPIRRRRRRSKRRFALPLGAMTSRTIPSGARSGKRIGALAPPPSMTHAARPVVRMRARVLCRSEAFGTGRDNLLACGMGNRRAPSARTASLAYALISSAIHPATVRVAGAHVYTMLASRVRMGEVPPLAGQIQPRPGQFRACLQRLPLRSRKLSM